MTPSPSTSGAAAGQSSDIKATPGKNMTILGSGSSITLFTEHGLTDEYQFMIDPVAIPDGTPVFAGITKKLELELIASKLFKSGVMLASYRPIAKRTS